MQASVFPEINGRFGFGFMRVPMREDGVDIPATSRLVDAFLQAGFNYFDTAHGYTKELNEDAIRQCLTSRYPRERYLLTDKLTEDFFQTEADIRPLFEKQLALCGVDYFDFYLMHAQDSRIFRYFQERRAYETAFALKAEGKVRHVGISFHDKADVLEEILTCYPEIEVVQIQFNYYDYEDASVESRKVYETCVRHGKPVIVMEPVKGGHLARLTEEAAAPLRALDGGNASNASYALRFAAGFEGIRLILSGMGNMDMLRDNVATMTDPRPLSDEEQNALKEVRKAILSKGGIPCTACRYCVAGCPKHLLIPDIFAAYNDKKILGNWNATFYYRSILTVHGGRAEDCIGCGACERSCPQHLPIRQLMGEIAQFWDAKLFHKK